MNELLFITDTYKNLNIKKDTSVLMIEEAIKNNFIVFLCELNDLFVQDGIVHASSRNIISAGLTQVEGILKEDKKVSDFKFSFMRKDPPVDQNYLNALHLLGLAEKQGATIFNKPNSIKEFYDVLGKVKFNLLTRYFKLGFIALGGINSYNFNQTKNLNIVACAMSSDKKKAGKYIPAFFKKTN